MAAHAYSGFHFLFAGFLVSCCLIRPVTLSCASSSAKIDAVFIMDESGSVGASNFVKMKEFVRDIVTTFNIGTSNIMVGVQKYSSSTNTEFNLNAYTDKNAMLTRIMAITYNGGSTNTAGALSYCRTNMFTTANGDRADAANVVFVLSDGVSNSQSQTTAEALKLRDLGVRIFSVGIGSGIPMAELNSMATDPDSDHVFAVSDFNALPGIIMTMGNTACAATDGQWSSYGSWGTCSVTCGGGTQTQSRVCNSPPPSNGGNACSGSATQTQACVLQSCPACASSSAKIDAVFIMDESGSVGASNFVKMKEFVRDIVTTFNIGTSNIMVGVQKYSSSTNTEFNLNTYTDKNAMLTRIMAITYNGGSTNTAGALSYCRTDMFTTANGDRADAANVVFVLSDGVSNSQSQTTAEALKLRDLGARIFSVGIGSGIPMAELNSMATDPDSDHVFAVSDFNALPGIIMTMGNTACAATDGQWSSYGSWETCSVTCGGGTQTQSRVCNSPPPSNGGNACSGSATQTQACNTQGCPVDGGWGAWQTWSQCSVTCEGSGVRTRIRDCDNPAPLHGGAACPAPAAETGTCDKTMTLCSPGSGWAPQTYSTTPGTPVDGGLGTWASWTACSHSCGGGHRLRHRQCNNPIPQFGGQDCSGLGAVIEQELCNNVACPGGAGYVQTCPARYYDCKSGNVTCVHFLEKCDCNCHCDDCSDEDPEWVLCSTIQCANDAGTVTPQTLIITTFFALTLTLAGLWNMIGL